LAQAIHNFSPRSYKPFVAVNLAAMPENLVESIFLGYVEGTFTGAVKGGKAGIFEFARGGTIFLDEIGDASLNVQSNLLRILQEKEIVRLGGHNVIPVDIRIISATNKPLAEYVKKGLFRTDLFYRLNVLPLKMPSLREMKDEVPHFIEQYLKEKYSDYKVITPDVMEILLHHEWNGNMRELHNVIDYMFNVSFGRNTIKFTDIPDYITESFISNSSSMEFCEIKDILQYMNSTGDINIFKFILEMLSKSKNKTASRNICLQNLREQGFCATEGLVRKHLKNLKDMGIIQSGHTKQGSWLTQKGILLYNNLLAK
jgi:transcriptional regulator with PAS, ATPase and Fis domain